MKSINIKIEGSEYYITGRGWVYTYEHDEFIDCRDIRKYWGDHIIINGQERKLNSIESQGIRCKKFGFLVDKQISR